MLKPLRGGRIATRCHCSTTLPPFFFAAIDVVSPAVEARGPGIAVAEASCKASRMSQRKSVEFRVRDALREATGAVHERLHEARPFTALMNKQLDMKGYTGLLRRIAAFHFTVGASLELDDARGKLLARDLDVLRSSAPARLDWRAPKSPAARLGWSYVAEGSSLGGRVIYRNLDYLFGNSIEGRCFFKGSADDRIRWQLLCDRIEAEGRTCGAVDEMIGGANDAFELFERALQVLVPAHV